MPDITLSQAAANLTNAAEGLESYRKLLAERTASGQTGEAIGFCERMIESYRQSVRFWLVDIQHRVETTFE